MNFLSAICYTSESHKCSINNEIRYKKNFSLPVNVFSFYLYSLPNSQARAVHQLQEELMLRILCGIDHANDFLPRKHHGQSIGFFWIAQMESPFHDCFKIELERSACRMPRGG